MCVVVVHPRVMTCFHQTNKLGCFTQQSTRGPFQHLIRCLLKWVCDLAKPWNFGNNANNENDDNNDNDDYMMTIITAIIITMIMIITTITLLVMVVVMMSSTTITTTTMMMMMIIMMMMMMVIMVIMMMMMVMMMMMKIVSMQSCMISINFVIHEFYWALSRWNFRILMNSRLICDYIACFLRLMNYYELPLAYSMFWSRLYSDAVCNG